MTPEQRAARAAARAAGRDEAVELARLCQQVGEPERLLEMLRDRCSLEEARARLGIASETTVGETMVDGLRRTAARMNAAAIDRLWSDSIDQARKRVA